MMFFLTSQGKELSLCLSGSRNMGKFLGPTLKSHTKLYRIRLKSVQ